MAEHGIGTRTLRGMFWAYGSYVAGRGLVLVATAILARILSPKEFGLVAAALVVTALLERFADFGLGQALIVQDEDKVLERADTAFVASLVLGTGLSVIVAGLSPLVAGFFDQPDVTPLLAVLGSNFALRSLSITHYSLAQKWLDFRTRTIAELADVVLRGGTSIVLALSGFGAWSLVLGYLAGTIGLTIALWALVPWRPKLRMRFADLPELARFGGGLSLLDLVAAAISNVDYVFVGRVLGPASLGLYTLGYRLPELLIANVSIVAGQVLFPAMASVSREDLDRAFQVALRYTLMLALPLAAGVAILAEPLILSLFGPKWEDSIAPMQVLTLYSLALAIGIPAGTAYKSVGRVDVLVKLAIPWLIVAGGALAVFADRGVVAVAACQAATAGLFQLIGIVLASRLLHTRLRRLAGMAVAPVIATAAMALVLVGVHEAVGPHVLQLVVGGLAGSAVYVGALALLAPDALRHLRATAFPKPKPPDDGATTRETDVT